VRVHDIGLYLRRSKTGELGFQVTVGGGLGATPYVGPTIREFLPVATLEPRVERRAGANEAGAHRGDHDVVSRQLGRDGAREAGQRELAGAVGRHVGHADLAADRRDVDDAAAALPAHVGDGRAYRVQRPPEVHGHRFLEIGQRRVLQRADRDHAGVVHQHVDGTVPIDDRLHPTTRVAGL